MPTITAIADGNTTQTWADALNALITVNNAAGQYLVAPDTGWTAVTFTNSWVDFGGIYDTVAYRKHSDGSIELKGTCKSGTIGVSMFTLPTGYRPSASKVFAIDSNSAFARVSVAASGTVVCTGGNNASVSLDGIRFRP